MHKKLNTSMIQYSYSIAHNWTGKNISINKIIDYNSDNLFRHIYELEKLSPPPKPPPPQSSISHRKLTSKGNLGKNTKCSKGANGCRLKYKQSEATMDYRFFSLQFFLFNVSEGFLI